jgi:ribosomal protein S12 methylthiotransferase
VRVHYLYPDEMTDELIRVIAEEPKIVKYLDLPIQHVNNTILKKMNRRSTREELDILFDKLRREIPDAVIRTSLITGLPGEGEEEFEELCNWLRKYKLERVGAFAFSPEEGTAAAKMEYPEEEVAVRRAEIVSEMQSRIMDEYNEKRIGTLMEVLCEGYDEEREAYFGRSYADSPDIDGRVFFDSEETLRPGNFVMVHITDVCDGDLCGYVGEEEA